MATAKQPKELKSQYFQNPQDLTEFINSNKLTIVAITAFDRFQALYYYDK